MERGECSQCQGRGCRVSCIVNYRRSGKSKTCHVCRLKGCLACCVRMSPSIGDCRNVYPNCVCGTVLHCRTDFGNGYCANFTLPAIGESSDPPVGKERAQEIRHTKDDRMNMVRKPLGLKAIGPNSAGYTCRRYSVGGRSAIGVSWRPWWGWCRCPSTVATKNETKGSARPAIVACRQWRSRLPGAGCDFSRVAFLSAGPSGVLRTQVSDQRGLGSWRWRGNCW